MFYSPKHFLNNYISYEASTNFSHTHSAPDGCDADSVEISLPNLPCTITWVLLWQKNFIYFSMSFLSWFAEEPMLVIYAQLFIEVNTMLC